MRNPTKVFATTLGKNDFIFHETPKNNEIKSFNNSMDKTRNQYSSKVPVAPQMTIEEAVLAKPRIVMPSESMLTLGLGTIQAAKEENSPHGSLKGASK